ncbi:glycosyltransferase [Roseomonas sp. F4]
MSAPAHSARPVPGPGGRSVLILDSDLFGQVGGGQSVYRRIIEQRPQDAFFYFRRDEAADAPRPGNAFGIPLTWHLTPVPQAVPAAQRHFLWVWHIARNMAQSVAETLGRVDFDVVDAPDYAQIGPFIRPALALEQCRVGVVAVSLHGTLSDAFRGGWPGGGDQASALAELRLRESLQFRGADARYAISRRYAAAWRRRAPLEVNHLDPLVVTGAPAPRPASRGEGAPDLVFAGRREKWKGPDLFIDAAWCLPPDLYRRLLLIGPDGPNRTGVGSEATLRSVARLRGLEHRLEMPGGLSSTAMQAQFQDRTLLLVPSRHDTFNLTALEALCAGCPTVVSDRAGVSDWLREQLPSLDWTVSAIDCSRGLADTAETILRDYDGHRDALAEALQRAALQPDHASLSGIHLPGGATDVRAREAAIELAAQLAPGLVDARTNPRLRAKTAMRQGVHSFGGWVRAVAGPRSGVLLPAESRARIRAVLSAPGLMGKGAALAWQLRDVVGTQLGRHSSSFNRINDLLARSRQLHGLSALPQSMAKLRDMPDRSAKEAEAKLRYLTSLVPSHRAGRLALFREMARLERRLGNPLTAATYLLRTLRWTGQDARGDLPFIVQTLRDHSFRYEAETCAAMFDGAEDSRDRCLALMRDAYQRNLSKPELPLAQLDDRRGESRPRAAVIVSLYNAADKLPTLLAMLARQTLARQGGVEVILVDSNSPADEHGAFARFAAEHPDLPIVYARSAERETIQAAWNRGIRLARAPYLAFLGADEGLHPDALRILAEKLDEEASTDWVMADSIVTNVDRHGVYDSDIMPYDRTGFRQDKVYLETCYLSWVGALYRRSIHERFGWYDESYRAAGDTEFKNRVMPHIRSAHVPLPLGVFNNYPEERTTQHPRAEIEDLRAWYLWRTPAGMDYAFARRPVAEAVELLHDCFGYRKSYCGHLSTDYDLAEAMSDHLMRRADAPDFAAAAWQESRRAIALLRDFEAPPDMEERAGFAMSSGIWGLGRLRDANALAHRQQSRIGLPALPRFDVFNDNRYEQHWWSWSVG